MAYRFEGEKYQATKGENRTQIAARIRRDIKAAVKVGTLPPGRYSVTVDGSSIRRSVRAIEAPGFQMHNPAYLVWQHANPHRCADVCAPVEARERFTAEARAILDAIDAIASAYTFDDSDSQSDVYHYRFGGHASFWWEYERDAQRIELARALLDATCSKPAPAAHVCPRCLARPCAPGLDTCGRAACVAEPAIGAPLVVETTAHDAAQAEAERLRAKADRIEHNQTRRALAAPILPPARPRLVLVPAPAPEAPADGLTDEQRDHLRGLGLDV